MGQCFGAGYVGRAVFGEEARQILLDRIRTGAVTLTLNGEQQEPHIKGSKMYDPKQKKSYFECTMEELQEVARRKAGTGSVRITADGQIKETIDVDVVAYDCDEHTGKPVRTHRATIHYSKNRTHIVPASDRK